MIKVALIGNMNNNNFSIMRYFADMGVDAHLFLFKDECSGSLSHFHPKCDTWEYARWKDRIHYLPVSRMYPWCFRNPLRLNFRSSKKVIKSIFSEYDYLIGSGMTPSMLAHVGMRLDVFVPYSTGVEYYGNASIIKCINGNNPFKKWAYTKVIKKQEQSIRLAKNCFNAEMGLTKDSLDKMGIGFERICLPTIYNREKINHKNIGKDAALMLRKIQSYEFSVFSHSRVMWDENKSRLDIETKNTDWLISSFKNFMDELNPNAVLIIVEYGPDVEKAKKLCDKLQMTDNVIFLPKMSRREIMVFLSICDVVSCEFCLEETKIWGGTGWEALASGKPLLQSIHQKDSEFKKEFGYPLPKICNVKKKEDVFKHLMYLYENPEACKDLGRLSKEWFNKYNGINLAKKWLSTMNENCKG